MIKAMVVDDEPLARVNIREALSAHSQWQLVSELDSGAQLPQVVRQLTPDVIFLDIQMPGDNGIEIARKLYQSAEPPLIIFVTAHDHYAIDAFELYALDYLLKPFDNQRFALTIARAEHALQPMANESSLRQWQAGFLSPQKLINKLLIRSERSIRIINLDEVYWFAASRNYVEVYHNQGCHLHRVTLAYLEAALDPTIFCRVHRSAIVRLSEVRELKTSTDNKLYIILTDGNRVPVSSAYKSHLLERIGID
ncbi:MAG: LytTR family DNA-binding domain-containing protein [Wenzhouxiangellaceae bacterium]